jgi:hypothetical protein
MRALVAFTFDSFIGDRAVINLHQARHIKEFERASSALPAFTLSVILKRDRQGKAVIQME